MKLSCTFVMTIVMAFVMSVVMVSANQCLVQNTTMYTLVDCNQLPSAINKWKLFGLIWFTCVALNINIFRAFILICVIVTINHDIITSMAKSYNICV